MNRDSMVKVLGHIGEMPVISLACKRAGISIVALKEGLEQSAMGVEGFDVIVGGVSLRFHDAWAFVMDLAIERIEREILERAKTYKIDPDLARFILTARKPIVY